MSEEEKSEESEEDEGKNPEDKDEQKSETGDEEKSEKEDGDKKKDKGKAPKPPSKKTLIIAGIVLVVLLIGALLYYLHARNFVSTDDAYTSGHVHEISARVAGTVLTLNVEDNQRVQAGQTLVVLDQRDFLLALDKARAQLAQANAQVVQGHASSDRAQADFEKAQSDYERTTGLFQKDFKAVSQAEVDAVTAALQNAKGALASAKAQLTVAEAGAKTAETEVRDAELQLSYATVVAPVDGLVGKRTVETGKRIQPGQALMAVVERDVWILANYKETQLARMRVGQHVEVKVDAVPDHEFSAHIDSLQPGTGSSFALLPPDNATGNFTKIVQRVPVKIVFDEHALDGFEDRVVPGLSVVPKIDLRTGGDDGPRATTR